MPVHHERIVRHQTHKVYACHNGEYSETVPTGAFLQVSQMNHKEPYSDSQGSRFSLEPCKHAAEFTQYPDSSITKSSIAEPQEIYTIQDWTPKTQLSIVQDLSEEEAMEKDPQ